MNKIITDNSKVNINLLEENDLLKKQIKKLQLDKEALKKQLYIHGVVFNEASQNNEVLLDEPEPLYKDYDTELKSEVELCEHKCTMIHENSVTGKYAYCLDCNTELKHN